MHEVVKLRTCLSNLLDLDLLLSTTSGGGWGGVLDEAVLNLSKEVIAGDIEASETLPDPLQLNLSPMLISTMRM